MPRLTNSLKKSHTACFSNVLKPVKTLFSLKNADSLRAICGFFNHLERNIRIRRCFQKLNENNVSHCNRNHSMALFWLSHILKNSDDIPKGPIPPTLKHPKIIRLVKKLRELNLYHIRVHRIYICIHICTCL